jgi:glucose-6-phosphate 1-dehydrogenase
MTLTSKSQPVLFVIFGATGDLNRRKIIPALYNLFLDHWIPEKFSIIGTSIEPMEEDAFRLKLMEGINQFSRKGQVVPAEWEAFSSHVSYFASDLNDDKTYQQLAARIGEQKKTWGEDLKVIFYLAVAPDFFPVIASHVAKNKLAKDPESARIVLEKPFGHDLETAKALNALLGDMYEEKQIYRIDHYLGKETVQNILAFRFANSILEPIWNRNYIEHVQITVSEQLGVEQRGPYYEHAGALRDMVQNHILQLLCLIAMETPVSFRADEVRNRKVDVLRSIRRFKPEEIKSHAARGQYSEGWIEGQKVAGYRDEPRVDPASNTETFAALKFFVDNWRWQGVPFYVRTGKRLQRSASFITIQFRDVPQMVFPADAIDNWQKNRLILSIQPEMSIRLQVQTKSPGLEMILNPVEMIYDYSSAHVKESPEAYETLLLDIVTGDQTLFMRADQVEAAWELLMPVLHAWQVKKSYDFPNYAAGSWGPETSGELLARDGFHWYDSLK